MQFVREWLEIGGFEAVYDGETPKRPKRRSTRFKASGALLVCLCGADEAYAEQAEVFAKAFKASGAKGVALAGRPGEFERAWRAAGVDEFIFAGGDAVATLQSLYRRIGVADRSFGNCGVMSSHPQLLARFIRSFIEADRLGRQANLGDARRH